jgi:hypothetical protein
MKLNLLVIMSTILSVTSMKQTIKPKLCINCQHFISESTDNKFGKCGLFPINRSDKYYLVNGVINKEDMDYYHCETARTYSNMCGENGDFHKRKYVKKQKDIFIPNGSQW